MFFCHSLRTLNRAKIELSCKRVVDLDFLSIHMFAFLAQDENGISGLSCRRELNFNCFFLNPPKKNSVGKMSIFEGCLSYYSDFEEKYLQY